MPRTLSNHLSGCGADEGNILAKITNRQTEVVRLYGTGLTYCEIAQRLTISMHTVKHHLANARQRTDCVSSVEVAVRVAVAEKTRS